MLNYKMCGRTSHPLTWDDGNFNGFCSSFLKVNFVCSDCSEYFEHLLIMQSVIHFKLMDHSLVINSNWAKRWNSCKLSISLSQIVCYVGYEAALMAFFCYLCSIHSIQYINHFAIMSSCSMHHLLIIGWWKSWPKGCMG